MLVCCWTSEAVLNFLCSFSLYPFVSNSVFFTGLLMCMPCSLFIGSSCSGVNSHNVFCSLDTAHERSSYRPRIWEGILVDVERQREIQRDVPIIYPLVGIKWWYKFNSNLAFNFWSDPDCEECEEYSVSPGSFGISRRWNACFFLCVEIIVVSQMALIFLRCDEAFGCGCQREREIWLKVESQLWINSRWKQYMHRGV